MLKIYFKMKEQYLKTEMEYTFNFWMMVFSGVLMRGLMLAVPFVIYRNIPDIAGWKESEVYLIMALLFLSEGLCNLFFDGIWYIPARVFRGELDIYLSRPVSPLFQVLADEVGLHGLGVVALGLTSMLLSLASMDRFTLPALLFCLFFIVCGTVIRMSVYLITNSLVFWFESGGTSNIPFTVYSIGEYARYPVTIYPVWMRVILLVVIPFGFIGFVPALILRGEHVLLYSLALAAMSALSFLVARTVFYRGIRRYESMGM
ncbi:MAG: ABC transporter permease [Oscillospiraceae bacterium]